MIDRVSGKLGRSLCEVPVGFKWFVPGPRRTARSASAARRAPAPRFLRRDGTAWSTDKDGIVAALLSAEITACGGVDPGEIYAHLTREFGAPAYDRVEAHATHRAEEACSRHCRPRR